MLPEGSRLIFQFIGGSHLYGTSTVGSDIDMRGVFIPPEQYFYGFLDRVEQVENKKDDVVYYDIRQFMKLALNNNPNIIEFLFVPTDMWDGATIEWQGIVTCRHWFVSKKAKFTFSGYAHSQFLRIKRHRGWLLNPPKKKPERQDFGIPDDRSLVSKDQIGAFNTLVAGYLEEIRQEHRLREQLDEMTETYDFKTLVSNLRDPNWDAIKTIVPVSDNMIEAVQKEKAYIQAKRGFDAYQSWKQNRNPDRAILEKQFGYDTKHASHLVRLMYECEELLKTGSITFPRPDAEILLGIRRGEWSYDELMQFVEDYDKWFDDLYEKTALPREPKRAEVNKLCINICRDYIEENTEYL